VLVDTDRRPVPVEHRPLHPPAPAPHRDARQRAQQGPAGALPALGRRDEEVFQVERGARQERRVREEVEGEADGPAAAATDEGLEVTASTEAVAPDARRGGHALARQPLVLGQTADQCEDGRDVAARTGTDRQARGGHENGRQAAATASSISV
jgi:hypothetical protein